VDTGEVKQFDDDDVNDCVITPDCNMYCKSCADSYRDELRDKVEALERLVHLHQELDPKNALTISLETSEEDSLEGNPGATESEFLVSKKFGTRFRTRVSNLLKSVGASELQSQMIDRGRNNETVCAGLDTMDLSDFELCKVVANDGRPTSSSKEELDYFVNSSITCTSND
jgi:citrate lyase gamma subunit